MIHDHVDVVPRDRATQIDRRRLVFGFGPETRAGGSDMKTGRAFTLYFVMLNLRRVFEFDVYDGIGQVCFVAGARVAFDYRGRASRFRMNDDAR